MYIPLFLDWMTVKEDLQNGKMLKTQYVEQPAKQPVPTLRCVQPIQREMINWPYLHLVSKDFGWVVIALIDHCQPPPRWLLNGIKLVV